MTSPYLLREPRSLAEVMAAREKKPPTGLPSFWRGCVAARDERDPKRAEYTWIAEQLERGVDPSSIAEITRWLDRRMLWSAKAQA